MADPILNRHSREDGNLGSTSSESLITNHIDIWTTAIERKSSAGRGTSNKFSLYGINKLRELILELAVRGKLVPQASREARNSANYEPASVLLERIAAEKVQLVKEGKLKKQKPLPEISEDEKPFELPDGWVWVRLNEVADYNGRPNLDPKNITDNTWLLDLEDIEKDTSKLIYKAAYSERESKSNKSTFQKGDVLYGKLRPYLNKVIIADDNGVCTTEIVPIVPNEAVNAEYLKYLLKSPSFLNYVNSLMYGVKMPRLGTDDAIKSLHPIAPLEEQHRIVAKVDELMSLCDALEAQTEASISAHQTLVETLLNALIAETSGKTTMDGAHVTHSKNVSAGAIFDRVAEHFDTLFTTEASIDTLKQTILQLAVMGKLVPQDPNDEPASKLLERIAAEKAQLIKDGKIKKQKPLPTITDEEKPFELPQGWEWCRLGTISKLMSGKGFKKSEYSESGARLFQIANVSLGYTKWEVENYMPLKYLSDYPELKLQEGDVLIALNRPLLNKRMKVSILSATDLPSILYQRVGKFDFYGLTINTKYFYYFLQSSVFIEHLYENLQGSDQPFINQSQLVDFLFSLPSLEEQRRIVAKVDELMALCDQLKARLSDAQTTQLHLTDAIVEQAI